MPSTTDKSETSKKLKPKSNKRLSKKRSPTNYENYPNNGLTELQISPQQHPNENNHNTPNSMQKRTKRIAELQLLVSDLSPKYIGFNPRVEGKQRNRSQSMVKRNPSPISPKNQPNIIENEGVLTNSLSYVKMTPINTTNDNVSSPSVDMNISPDFESPIEKLIKKNKELSNLSSSSSITNEDDFLSEKGTPKKYDKLLSTKLKNKSIVEQKTENLILINKDSDFSTNSTTNILSKSSTRKNRILKQTAIKKTKLTNSTKSVPLKNQIILSDLNITQNIESEISPQEIEIRNFKNTPQKIRSAQVVLHKSPQIERMHNEQMRNKKNSKIFQNVHILSEMTKTQNIERISKIENISTNSKICEKQDLSPEFSTIDLINTRINNDKDITTEKDCLSQIETIVNIPNRDKKINTTSHILSNNYNLTENSKILNNENISESSNIYLQEKHVSVENNVDKLSKERKYINGNNDCIIAESKSETTTNLSVEKEIALSPALLNSETCEFYKRGVDTKTVANQSVEECENIKNTQSICDDEGSLETDLTSKNLPITDSPLESTEKNINMQYEHMEKVDVKKNPVDIMYQKNISLFQNGSLETEKCHNMEIKTYGTSNKLCSTQMHTKEMNQLKNTIMEFSQTLESNGKINLIDNNKLIDINKFTEIENSELALENILYENDVLGTGSNIDEDFEIMNISSDFDDLNNSTTLELETPNSNLQINKENDNGKLSITKNNSPASAIKTIEETIETIPKTVIVHEKLFNIIISNDLIDKKIGENETMDKETEHLNVASSAQVEEIQIFKTDMTIEEKPEILNKTGQHVPTTSQIQIAPDNEAFAYTLMSNARATKSPLSTDSAKGSSIDIETNFHPKFGEIFWARISKYPFWPCIVWPDPDGKTISIGKNGARQHIRIHVKFFADNGRRSWIRKEDLMAYNGREDFERKKKEFWEQNNISKRNLLARAFLINESKKPLWNQAVIEASLVLNEHIEKRSEKFEKILEETRELQFFERRKKRLSLNERHSSLSSIAGSEEIRNHNTINGYEIKKRDRSPTPESPSFEDVQDFKTFIKKRKIDLNVSTNFNQLKKTSSLIQLNETSSSDLYESEEIDFNGFTELMTDFIQPEKEEEQQLFINLKEIWEIKLRSEATKNFNLTNKNNNNIDGEQNFKRFSKRQTTLLFRRSLPVQKRLLPPVVTKEKSDKPKKERIPGVPIVKVVEGILELNKNYLFNGLKREPVCKVCLKPTNLYKCSANCQSWIHEICADLPEAVTLPSKNKDRKFLQYNISNSDLSIPMHITGDEKLITENNKVNNEILHINENEILNTNNTVEAVPSIEIICKECKDKLPPICYVCKENEKENNENDKQITETPIKCNINSCGKYFHTSCLKYWPQARLTKSKTKIERFICPSHTCQTCVSDDPKGKFLKLQNCAKCVLCPASYHIDSTCIPAGSKIITATELICPRHRQNKQILNTNWCFICSDGGNLVCCESCPTSFHLECLNIDKLPDAGYICEECETGRLPLYGELIWAKFGVHKWWPCITIPPPQIPTNLYRVKHHEFDFCVRFFGTNDHSWISRDRVFLYQEDDWRYSSKVKTNDKDFIKSLEEANSISELLKAKKIINKNNDKKMLLVPTPYKKINVNRPVPPVKLQEIYISDELNPCNCNPNNEKPCDIFSGCLNRLLMIECHPKICPAGNKCNNQMFEKRLYAAIKVVRTSGKGFGLVSDELITAGTFIIEYVGELIDDNELKRRIAQKQEEKDENYYFLTMQHGLIIDAGPKGNMARFMNHSCQPNCETQKWNVNGNTRIGLFAINDIPPNTELTFNYNLECIGDDRKPCNCGAEKCAGFIGAKYKKNDKKIDILISEIPKTEKMKSKGNKRNKSSLSLATNFPLPIVTTIPKNS